MVYSEALAFLGSLQMFGARPGLERVARLAEQAGHPERELRFIHVAGTNGKGSTCAMLEAIYRGSGRRTGLYTSPHLVSFRERIQLNRKWIPEADVVRLTERIQAWLGEFTAENHPTFFEVVTLMALMHFAEQGCDVVIWETGLGGRLDATNIVTPLASVITNVQLDHQKWLGNTPAEIAQEKAGIIKPRVPVVTTARDESVLQVLRTRAAEVSAPLHIVHEPLKQAELALEGEHQRLNAAATLKVVEVLAGTLPVLEPAIQAGLRSVSWPGRFQVIRRGRQTLVLDGAHNAAGAAALAHTLQQRFPEKITLVLGILEDKDAPEICRILAPVASRLVTVPVANSRTASAEQLAQMVRHGSPGVPVESALSLADALAKTAGDSIVVVAGSLYLIGEAMELLGEVPAQGERALNEWSARPR
jgi:dihydrofolate synthase/folylpolyglutamate synthase